MGDMADYVLDQVIDQWCGMDDGLCSGDEESEDLNKLVDINYEDLEYATGKAWLVRFANNKTSWFPKSRCALRVEDKVISIPIWLCLAKGEKEFDLKEFKT